MVAKVVTTNLNGSGEGWRGHTHKAPNIIRKDVQEKNLIIRINRKHTNHVDKTA